MGECYGYIQLIDENRWVHKETMLLAECIVHSYPVFHLNHDSVSSIVYKLNALKVNRIITMKHSKQEHDLGHWYK